MGQVNSSNGQIITDLQNMRSRSRTLNSMLDKVLQGGDLTIRLQSQLFSSYNNRDIVVGVGQPGQFWPKEQVQSELVMEICNAWYDASGLKPSRDDFGSANDYAKATEYQEWRAVQDHIKIFEDLQPSGWPPSRFRQAFEDPQYAWSNFNNYLAYQESTGHTQRIASHWAPAVPPPGAPPGGIQEQQEQDPFGQQPGQFGQPQDQHQFGQQPGQFGQPQDQHQFGQPARQPSAGQSGQPPLETRPLQPSGTEWRPSPGMAE